MPRSSQPTRGVKQKQKPSAKKRRVSEPPSEPAAEVRSPREAAAESTAVTMGDYADVSKNRATIVSVIKGLEGQVDTAFRVKGVLEADLDAAQKKLSEELAARAELEARVESLEAQTGLVDRLREDISFTEGERNRFANSLAEAQRQLEAMTQERDSLVAEAASAKARAEELEDEKTVLEAQVMNLTDNVADMQALRGELAAVTEARGSLAEQVRDLSSRLEASDRSKSSLETNLAGAHEGVRGLREEAEDLRKRLADADGEVTELRVQLEEQQAANRDLMETRTRLESEMKTSNVNHVATRKELEAVKNELEAARKALREVYGEVTGASRRVRERYLKEKQNEPEALKRALHDVATDLSSTTARVRRQQLEGKDEG